MMYLQFSLGTTPKYVYCFDLDRLELGLIRTIDSVFVIQLFTFDWLAGSRSKLRFRFCEGKVKFSYEE